MTGTITPRDTFRTVTIGRSTTVHAQTSLTFCGAEGRRGVTYTSNTSGPVTCKRCIKSLAATVEADHAEALAEDAARAAATPATEVAECGTWTSTATEDGTFQIRDGLHNWLGEVAEIPFQVGEMTGKLWGWRRDESESWSYRRYVTKGEAVGALLDELWREAMEEDLYS